MIKLERPAEPIILQKNKAQWTQALLDSIARHGSYEKIPEKEKAQLLSHYRHQDITNPLFESSYQKCAFCECKPTEGGNIEVEHYKPKSSYPGFTFDWVNYLPSCRKCNGTKLTHDTVAEPIVNPYESDPEDYFFYRDIQIKAKPGINQVVAKRTIAICGLDTVRLWKPRADILVTLRIFASKLEMAIEAYQSADSERKKINRLRDLTEAIEQIEMLISSKEKYSAFCSNFLTQCDAYLQAKNIIARGLT